MRPLWISALLVRWRDALAICARYFFVSPLIIPMLAHPAGLVSVQGQCASAPASRRVSASEPKNTCMSSRTNVESPPTTDTFAQPQGRTNTTSCPRVRRVVPVWLFGLAKRLRNVATHPQNTRSFVYTSVLAAPGRLELLRNARCEQIMVRAKGAAMSGPFACPATSCDFKMGWIATFPQKSST